MRAVVDENLPKRLAVWLTAKGWQASHVGELGLTGQDDAAIEAWAEAEAAIIVTQDRDFERPVERTSGARVLRLGVGNATPAALIAWMEARWDQVVAWVADGSRYLDLA